VDEEIHIVGMLGVDATYFFADDTMPGLDLCPAALDGVEDLNVSGRWVEKGSELRKQLGRVLASIPAGFEVLLVG